MIKKRDRTKINLGLSFESNNYVPHEWHYYISQRLKKKLTKVLEEHYNQKFNIFFIIGNHAETNLSLNKKYKGFTN